MIAGNHTRWVRTEEPADDPERIAIREALAFGKALYDVRTTLSLTIAELAQRAGPSNPVLRALFYYLSSPRDLSNQYPFVRGQ